MVLRPTGRRAALRFVLWIAVALLPGAYTSPAFAGGPWYVSGSVGGLFRQTGSWNSNFINFASGVTGSGVQQETFDPGFLGNIAIGYGIWDRVRVETEFGYGTYRIAKLNPRATPTFPNLNGTDFNRQSGGDVDQFSGTVNLFYDLPIGAVIPYIGGGIGILHSELQQGVYASNVARFALAASSPSAGLVLAEVGVAIPIDHISIVPAYRFMQTFGENGTLHAESSHVVKLGVRYAF
ncbi:MAG: hypothetical protein JO021_14775 [Alphaproteobacteria bacterium]|nr:hypothetical protein [Alphaproteobacteria bacterium]